MVKVDKMVNTAMSILNVGNAVCHTLLMKTSRVFLASARKSRPVFLPLKTAPPIGRRRGFSRQSEGRHNTLYFAFGKVCGKGYAPAPQAAAPRVKRVAPAPHFRFGLPPEIIACG